MKVTMIHYPHGWNRGGVTETDISPAITISSWENNHGIIEYESNVPDREDRIRKEDEKNV